MSTQIKPSNDATSDASVARVDMKFEVVVIPVSDVDRAKEFYAKLGWRLDAEFSSGDDFGEGDTGEGESSSDTTDDGGEAGSDCGNGIVDPGKRLEKLLEAERILMADMPVIPIYYYAITEMRNTRLQNAFPNPLGMYSWKDVHLAP